MNSAFEAAKTAYREQRWQDAVEHATAALDSEPHNLEALNLFGLAWFQLGYVDNAIQSIEYCHQKAPYNATFASNLGEMYRAAGRYQESIDTLTVAATLKPDSLPILSNVGLVCLELQKLDEAEAALRKVLEFDPESALAHFNLSEVYRHGGRWDEAIASLQAAIARKPDFAEAHTNLGICLLARGDYLEGWPEFDWRLDSSVSTLPVYPQPRWEGQLEQSAQVLVRNDQGLGDAVMFARYLPHLHEQGVNLIVECPAPLQPLWQSSFPGLRLYTPGTPLPEFQYQIALGSLPRLYGTDTESVPNLTPYLAPDQALVSKWAAKLAPYQDTIRIGVRWAGNPAATGWQRRSCPLELIETIFAGITNITLVSLETERQEEAQRLKTVAPLLDFSAELTDLAETAALMANLELVISVDTLALNLAAALDVPAWGLLPYAPEWRWQGEEQRSRWYPSVWQFRQPAPGDWRGAALALRSALLGQINQALAKA